MHEILVRPQTAELLSVVRQVGPPGTAS